MQTSEIELTTPDGPMTVYEAAPDGPVRGAVIVVQEAFGVNDHIQDVTRRFADAGYHAVAPSLFHRDGNAVIAYDDFPTALPWLQKLAHDALLADIDATIAHLHDAGFGDPAIGIVGFCFGGRVSFLVSATRTLGAGVSFYGGGVTQASPLSPTPLMDEVDALRTPWLGLFGDQDAGIAVEGVERLREHLQATPVDTEIVRYPDAGHGFHCDQRASYHEPSSRDAWARTLDWLGTRLTGA